MITQTQKDRWVNVLRGDYFTQGFAFFKAIRRGKPTYCAIGVLIELNNPAFFVNNESGYMNLGIEVEAQKIIMKMNDKGYSFNEIADWIEANIEAIPDPIPEFILTA